MAGSRRGIVIRRGMSPYEKVMARSKRRGKCLIYTGPTVNNGYGKVSGMGTRPKTLLAHRVVAEHHLGPAPEGRPFVLHSCDNRLCVEITHLRYGTQKENRRDAMLRRRTARGATHGSAVLTVELAKQLLSLRSDGWTMDALAAEFSVSQGTVSNVCTGKHWTVRGH